MKYRIGCILLLLTLCTTIRADKMEQRYQEVRELYTTREKTAQQELKQYLQKVYVSNPAAEFSQAPATKVKSMPYDLMTLIVKGR